MGSWRASAGTRGVLGKAQFLALVQVGRAGEGERNHGGGPGTGQAQRRVGLLILGGDALRERGGILQPEARGVPDGVVVAEHPGGGGPHGGGSAQGILNGRRRPFGVPAGQQEVEVERLLHFIRPDVPGQPLGRLHPGLGHQHAVAVVFGQHPVPVTVDVVDAVLVKERRRGIQRRDRLVPFTVAVVAAATLPVPAPAALPAAWARCGSSASVWPPGASPGSSVVPSTMAADAFPVGQSRFLDHAVGHVHAEAVHAAVQPEPQHRAHFLLDLGVFPVQVRLLGVEQVQVPVAGPAVGLRDAGPGRTAKDGLPVVRCQVAVAGTGNRILAGPEHVPVPFAGPRGCRKGLLEPGVFVRGVVGDQVNDHLEPQAVSFLQHFVEVRPACRTADPLRGSRRRRTRHRPAVTCRRGTARRHPPRACANGPGAPLHRGDRPCRPRSRRRRTGDRPGKRRRWPTRPGSDEPAVGTGLCATGILSINFGVNACIPHRNGY